MDQADDIPWELLTGNIQCHVPKKARSKRPAGLVFRFQKGQADELYRFADSFASTLEEATRHERLKYQKRYEPPAFTDVILDDETVRRISPVVSRWRQHYPTHLGRSTLTGKLCQHGLCRDIKEEEAREQEQLLDRESDDDERKALFHCECPIPHPERTAYAFLRQYVENDCFQFYQHNGRAFYNVELIKTLILHGHMEPLLRACAHPDADFWVWNAVQECYCDSEVGLGWDRFFDLALTAYLGLNVLYCFPELWASAESHDYRKTQTYKQVLKSCTTKTWSRVSMHPHREFFGIHEGSWPNHPFRVNRWDSNSRRGGKSHHFAHDPKQVFCRPCEEESDYCPHVSEVDLVSGYLSTKGLPAELVLCILRFAGYGERPRHLLIGHDPFHPENRKELQGYLELCWGIMVRCNMFAREQGADLACVPRVISCLDWILGKPKGKDLYQVESREGNGEDSRRTWVWSLCGGRGRVFWEQPELTRFRTFMSRR